MPRMMSRQLDYALERLDDAVDGILGPRPCDDRLGEEKADAEVIRTGQVKFTQAMVKRVLEKFDVGVKNHQNRWCPSIASIFEEELLAAIKKARKPLSDRKEKQWDARNEKLQIKYIEAKDELILGDVDRALLLIAAFRKTKV